jgi:hypothetical protein
MATACLCGFPACTSVRMFSLMTFFELPDLSGTICLRLVVMTDVLAREIPLGDEPRDDLIERADDVLDVGGEARGAKAFLIG